MRGIAREYELPHIDTVHTRIVNPRKISTVKDFDLDVINPHDLLRWMWHNHNDQFMMRCVGSKSGKNLIKFWESLHPEDPIWDTPSLRGLGWGDLEMKMYWQVFGDGVPVTKTGAGKMSLLCLTHGSVTGIGGSKSTTFLNTCIPDKLNAKMKPRGSFLGVGP